MKKWLIVSHADSKKQILDFEKHADLVGDVTFVNTHDLIVENEPRDRWNDYFNQIEPLLLGKYLNLDEYDFVFVFQSKLLYLKFPEPRPYYVLYYHTEPLFAPSCLSPDVLFYSFKEAYGFITNYYPQSKLAQLFREGKDAHHLIFSAEPDLFQPEKEKDIEGLCFIGPNQRGPSPPNVCWYTRDIYTNRFMALDLLMNHTKEITEREGKSRKKVKKIVPDPLVTILPRMDYEEFCETLSRCETHLCVGGNYCYNYLRMFEAAAAGAIPILFLEEKMINKNLYNSIGLKHKKNCIYFETMDQLRHFIKNWFPDKEFMAKIRQGAIEWSKTQTNRHRITQIIENIGDRIHTLTRIAPRDSCDHHAMEVSQ